MSSKKLRRELIAAIAMVIVAAIALGSSTFAWFVASNEVTATGMKVQVNGESGIVIRPVGAGESDPFKSVATITMDAASLKPASTNDLEAWYHASSDNAANAKAQQNADDYVEITTAKLPEHVLVKSFNIRSASESIAVQNVKLVVKSVTVTGGSDNIDKAVRVGVKLTTGAKSGTNEFFIYAPMATDDFELVATYAEDATLTEKTAPDDPSVDYLQLASDTVPCTDTGLEATIYVWFEGEDENCMSENVDATPDSLTASVVFGTVAVQPAQN